MEIPLGQFWTSKRLLLIETRFGPNNSANFYEWKLQSLGSKSRNITYLGGHTCFHHICFRAHYRDGFRWQVLSFLFSLFVHQQAAIADDCGILAIYSIVSTRRKPEASNNCALVAWDRDLPDISERIARSGETFNFLSFLPHHLSQTSNIPYLIAMWQSMHFRMAK